MDKLDLMMRDEEKKTSETFGSYLSRKWRRLLFVEDREMGARFLVMTMPKSRFTLMLVEDRVWFPGPPAAFVEEARAGCA